MLRTVFLAIVCVAVVAGCGTRNGDPDDFDKIVGGQAAQHGEYPWQVSLQRSSWGSSSHFCGGTIIDATHVITAAHCIEGVSASSLTVIAGDHRLRSNDGTEQSVKVSRIIGHEQYNSNTLVNDIAILKLSSSLNLNSAHIGTACLPTANKQAFSGYCTVTGWGTLREGGSVSDVLQEVSVPLITDAKCRQQYGTSTIKDHMLCAGHDQGGKDACQGDSGGPLVCVENGRSYLAGVVSWGNGCARPNYAGIYTEVSHFLDWIQRNTY